MRKKKHSKRLQFFKKMPPLHNTIPGKEFDPNESEIVSWIQKNPELILAIWDVVKNTVNSKDPLVFYNKETGKWQGVDYGK